MNTRKQTGAPKNGTRKTGKPAAFSQPYRKAETGSPESGYRTLATRWDQTRCQKARKRIQRQILNKIEAETIQSLFLTPNKRAAQVTEICTYIQPKMIGNGKMPFISWFHHHGLKPGRKQLEHLLFPGNSYWISKNRKPEPRTRPIRSKKRKNTPPASVSFDIQPSDTDQEKNRELIRETLRLESLRYLTANPNIILSAISSDSHPAEWIHNRKILGSLEKGSDCWISEAARTLAKKPEEAIIVTASETPFGKRVAIELGKQI